MLVLASFADTVVAIDAFISLMLVLAASLTDTVDAIDVGACIS